MPLQQIESVKPGTELASESRRLPRRDLWLLPALSLLTIISMFGISEIIARALWPHAPEDACAIPHAGRRSGFRAHCESNTRVAESSLIHNTYNDCGYRTRESCGLKPPQTIRVAVLGSSFSYGYMTPYADAYTTLAAEDLSRRCHRPVEFQNLGVPQYSMLDMYERLNEALALKPDVLLLAVNAVDVHKDISPGMLAHRDAPEEKIVQPEPHKEFLKQYIVTPFKESRALYMLQHFLYQDPDTFLNLFLLYGDNAGYLRTPFTPQWQQRFANMDLLMGEIEKKAQAQSVPVVLFVGPLASQAAALNTQTRQGIDPLAFSHKMEALAAKHHIGFVDGVPSMRVSSKPMGLFYVMDGHPDSRGQRLLATALDQQLPALAGPVLSACQAR